MHRAAQKKRYALAGPPPPLGGDRSPGIQSIWDPWRAFHFPEFFFTNYFRSGGYIFIQVYTLGPVYTGYEVLTRVDFGTDRV